jgi:DNA relaxase NicK
MEMNKSDCVKEIMLELRADNFREDLNSFYESSSYFNNRDWKVKDCQIGGSDENTVYLTMELYTFNGVQI